MSVLVGLGWGGWEDLPEINQEALLGGVRIYTSFPSHPALKNLREFGVHLQGVPDKDSLRQYRDRGIGTFAGVGDPLREDPVARAFAAMFSCEVLRARSFLDVVGEEGMDLAPPYQVWCAGDPVVVDSRCSQLVYFLPHTVQGAWRELRKAFREETLVRVYFLSGDGLKSEVVRLSAGLGKDWKCGVFWVEGNEESWAPGFYGLVEVVDRLLGPGGCPWDRAQTHETLKKHLLEETYETLEAIDRGDPQRLCEELGDFLLQAVMHAQMDAQKGLYSIHDVVRKLTEKLVRRHPHVFGDGEAKSAEDVLKNWDEMKQKESSGEVRSVLGGVPMVLPSLLRAYEVGVRAGRVGFDWTSLEGVWEKLREEEGELEEAVRRGDREGIEREVGDVLFAMVNLARWLGVEPEDALRRMVNRFVERFAEMERLAPKPLKELSLEEWDELWERAKGSSS